MELLMTFLAVQLPAMGSIDLASTVGQFLSQPNPNRVATFLTWVRSMRLNHAWSDGSASDPEQTLNQINQSILHLSCRGSLMRICI